MLRAFCRGNQGNANFRVSLHKYLISTPLHEEKNVLRAFNMASKQFGVMSYMHLPLTDQKPIPSVVFLPELCHGELLPPRATAVTHLVQTCQYTQLLSPLSTTALRRSPCVSTIRC